MKTIDWYISKIKSCTWKEALALGEEMIQTHEDNSVEPLIQLLLDETGDYYNIAALLLAELKTEKAVPHILDRINLNRRISKDFSTLVYSLENLDCSNYLRNIVLIALSKAEDSRLAALNILYDQSFQVSDAELTQLIEEVKGLKVDDEIFDIILTRLEEMLEV